MNPTLEDWAVVTTPISPYQAPEARSHRLHGKVSNHNLFVDGAEVTTSAILGKQGEFVVVKSGKLYSLGTPAEDYERQFPDAKERLFDSLPEIG